MNSAKMHNQINFIRYFANELETPSPDPELLALYIAGIAYPELDIEANLKAIDRIAMQVSKHMKKQPPGRARAESLLNVLHGDLRFDGSHEDYYDSRNSFLNQVLERRRGLPITLSLLCMAIGRRLNREGFDIRIEGLGFPGHFMASYVEKNGTWILDPFNGEVVNPEETSAYLAQLFQKPVSISTEALRPVSAEMLAYRLLNNLRMVYLDDGDYELASSILDYMLVLTPNDSMLWRERGLLHYHREMWEYASRDFRRYFFLKDNLLLALGMLEDEEEEDLYDEYAYNDEAFEAAVAELSVDDQYLLQMLEEVEEIRSRIN
jgi:regulator of sirC expression with transglutaminase-like and TPR domain